VSDVAGRGDEVADVDIGRNRIYMMLVHCLGTQL
jgi:hypothetical protein